MMSSMMMDRCGGEYAHEIAESLRFQEEIQSLMRLEPPGPESGSSFTALLGLPPNQAMELLHHEPPGQPPPAATVGNTNVREAVIVPSYGVDIPFGCSPTFPSNAALVERAARYSVFASPAEDSPVSSTVPSNSGGNNISHYSGSYRVKSEPADSDSNNGASSFAIDKPPQPSTPATGGQQRSGKRKEPEKSKAKSGGGGRGKKSKGGDFCEDDGAKDSTGGEKLPYVHVRARRGQATDSHSLAERARREKINARMKLLQELVPGCSKISGTALVLDEIINHVQSLQRQVEFLSMRLAALNPGVDFSGIDNFLAAENARLTGGNEVGAVGLEAPLWGEVPIDGIRRHHHQRQIWQPDQVSPQQSPSMWEREDNNRRDHHHHYSHEFIAPGHSMLCYETATPVPLHANQLKTEI